MVEHDTHPASLYVTEVCRIFRLFVDVDPFTLSWYFRLARC